MICLRYEGDTLVEVSGHPWGNPHVLVRCPPTKEDAAILRKLLLGLDRPTPRERRRLARSGRKFPIRVARWREEFTPMYQRAECLIAYRFRRTNPFSGPYAPSVPEDFLLYLPQGESSEDPKHLAALTKYTDELYRSIRIEHERAQHERFLASEQMKRQASEKN